MNPICKLTELVDHVKNLGNKKTIAVAAAQDDNTILAVANAINNGLVNAQLYGCYRKIVEICQEHNINSAIFTIIDEPDEWKATYRALESVKSGSTDVLMKGLVGTDKFLHSVLDKNNGLLNPNAILSYVCAVELPKYNKLLFLSDTAVIPFPDLKQKTAMINYAINMANKFGIKKPKVALLSASEKFSERFTSHNDYSLLCKMAERNQIKECIVDGPLDLFLACDKESIEIKGVNTPIEGEADILIFPSLESANIFYKGLMLFGAGELAGLIQGTAKPVVVMSRSESSLSKYYCIALSCLMAENN